MARLLIIMMAGVWASFGWAGQVVDIYRAETLVASQSRAERQTAAQEAFVKLVQRVSGDRHAPDHELVAQAAEQAEDYIYEFNYASTDKTLEVGGRPVPATRLVLKFSPVAVERLLRSAGLSLWPANRPAVLVWLVEDTPEGLSQPSGEQTQALRQAAKTLGLPLVLPLHDLEDRLALSARDLWRMDESAVREASKRYSADAILVGRYSRTSGGEIRSNWQLYHSMGNPTFSLSAMATEGLLMRAFGRVADHFADLYAITPREEGPGATVLQVTNVQSFEAYKEAQRYLNDLPIVRGTELISSRSDRLTLRIFVEADLERFEATLAADGRLTASADTELGVPDDRFLPRGTQVNPLSYEWRH